ncbi:MAG: response regulator [Magnetococcales bacterium]|nr:response regulator [Magnetococcales bacterium]
MDCKSVKHKILIVDDAPIIIKEIVNILKTNYHVVIATNGQEAIEIASTQDIDLILLDVVMPGMDGFEVCKRMKDNEISNRIPIIFITAENSEEEISRGLNLGAYYYLTKPLQKKVFLAVVSSALADMAESVKLREKLRESATVSTLCLNGKFIFRTLEEAFALAVFLANTCPYPEKVGIGLRELFINAIEHGNLGITYEEKSSLCENNQIIHEIERRLVLKENLSKHVTVQYHRSRDEIIFHIIDQGLGFDWKHYLEFDPSRAFDIHGRGIALAVKTSFDRVEYKGMGNEVFAVIKTIKG